MTTPPPPPPPPEKEGGGRSARKPWAKPVLATLADVTAAGTGTKQPSPNSYEGAPEADGGDTPYQSYGPFSQI